MDLIMRKFKKAHLPPATQLGFFRRENFGEAAPLVNKISSYSSKKANRSIY